MDQSEIILQAAYKTARMGAQTISTVLPKTMDQKMRGQMISHLSRFDELSDRASEEMIRLGSEVKENSASEKMADFMVALKAAMNREATNLAEMMMNGAVMGVIELNRARNENPSANPSAHQVAKDLEALCETVIQDMKAYL